MDKKDFPISDIGKKVELEIEKQGLLSLFGVQTIKLTGEIKDVGQHYVILGVDAPKTGTRMDDLLRTVQLDQSFKYDSIKSRSYLP